VLVLRWVAVAAAGAVVLVGVALTTGECAMGPAAWVLMLVL